MLRRFLIVGVAFLLAACASPSSQWASPLHKHLYESQRYYAKTGRHDIGCFIGVRPETGQEEVICTTKENIPANAMQSPRTSHITPAYTPSTGGTVRVRGYTRKDGTYVRPHTRRSRRR